MVGMAVVGAVVMDAVEGADVDEAEGDEVTGAEEDSTTDGMTVDSELAGVPVGLFVTAAIGAAVTCSVQSINIRGKAVSKDEK